MKFRILIEQDEDGISHDDKEEYDAEREKRLIGMVFNMLRFTDEEVLGNGNLVIDRIEEELNRRV